MKHIGTMLVLIFVASSSLAVVSAALPVWVVDPATPGPDVPDRGGSLFDRITTDDGGVQKIPFPFERLMARIETAAGCQSANPCTRAVLIPLGRSLQRMAAAPDFFAHPRAVVAVTEQATGMLLRDRLYLGFQAHADVIEVISYNEEAGRFEFQIVSDYGKHTARVSYARRALCVACHQNHGPIFSQPLWLETNANPQVAAALRSVKDSFHGVAATAAADVSQAIDDATDRSTRMLLTQRLWRDGCGEGAEGDSCRRNAVKAALQLALTGARVYEQSSQAPITQVIERFDARTASLWPAGLAVGSSDLSNRNPFDVQNAAPGRQAVDIEARFDPLVPRRPAEILPPDARSLADDLVRGATGFISTSTRDRIAKAMAARDRLHAESIRCRTSSSGGALYFRCEEGARLAGSVVNGSGVLDEVQLPNEPALRHLDLQRMPSRSNLAMRIHERGRKVRLPSGRAIDRLEIEPGETPYARLWIGADFPIDDALEGMPDATLSVATFDRLADRLEGRASSSVAVAARTFNVDDDLRAHQTDPSSLPFEAPCGSCHRTSQPSPPNFLSGSRERVRASLRSCAPRMLVRLSMNQLEPTRRAKSPMPPEFPSLSARSPDAAERASLGRLRSSVEAMLREEYGRVPTVAELMRDGYESLRPCLPPDR